MNKRVTLAGLLLAPLALGGCSHLPTWLGGDKEDKPKLAGERVTVLPVAAELKADDTLKGKPVTLPVPTANADWPQHTGLFTAATSNLAAGGSFTTLSKAKAGEHNAFHTLLVPRPVVAGGLVFAMDGVGMVSAHDAADITRVRWQAKAVSEKDEPDVIGGGLAIADGKLYITSGRGVVAALNAADGTEIWKKTLRTPFRSAPKIAGGKLFAVTIDNQLYALNAATGEVLWTHRGINETAGILSSVSPAIAGDNVIAPYSSGELYALAMDNGKEMWVDSLMINKHTQASAEFAGIGGDPVVDGNAVFAVSNGGAMSVVAADSGQRYWERPVSSMNTPWVAGDYLFLLTADNTLVCFVKFDGRVAWATKLPGYLNPAEKRDPITWRGPVLVGGKLAIVGSQGKLMLVSAIDGAIVSEQDIPENIYTAPVVAGGRMYLLGQDAKLYALQ